MKTGKQLRELKGHTHTVMSVAFSPDGDRIVSGSRDSSVRVWDVRTGEQLRELRSDANHVIFSPDSPRIVSGSESHSVRVWDVQAGKQLRMLRSHTNGVNSVAFSPDGDQIVSGSWDKSVRVWDAKIGEQLKDLKNHNHTVHAVAFSPDDNQIVTSSSDNPIHIWDDSNVLWAMDEDGWILSHSERLIWVPSTLGEVLYHPHTILIISRRGSARLSFEGSRLGVSWRECYTP
jgi:WD40 repeat protein